MASASFRYSDFDILLHRDQCFICTEICIGPLWLHQPDCTGNYQGSAVMSTRRSTSACANGVALPGATIGEPEMSATLSTITRPAVTRRPGACLRFFRACCEEIARHFVRRAAVATLRELDDHALRDIGLARSQIEAAVHGFMPAPRPGEDVIMASSAALQAAIGPRASGRATLVETTSWS